MSAFECYKEYIAIKNHFSQPAYDYFKYQGKVKAVVETFNKRKDKIFFEKLAKHPDVHNFLIANLSENEKSWIKELAYNKEAENIYKNWLKKQQSLSYFFKNDLSKLKHNFDENFICNNHEHPYLLKLYLGKQISLETFCLLLEITGAQKHWDCNMEYDLIWDSIRLKVKKYIPFIKHDKQKMKKIVIDFFSV